MKKIKLAFACAALSAVMLVTACGKQVEKIEYSHGTIEENKFSTEMFGLTAEIDDGWKFLTDEELATVNGVSDMSAESIASAIDANGVVYEMCASNDNGASITFIVEDLSKNKLESLDENGYVDTAFPSLKSQLEAQGLTVDNIEKTTAEFAGNSDSQCVKIDVSISGNSLFESQYYKKAGQYMAVITITGFSREESDELASNFAAL